MLNCLFWRVTAYRECASEKMKYTVTRRLMYTLCDKRESVQYIYKEQGAI